MEEGQSSDILETFCNRPENTLEPLLDDIYNPFDENRTCRTRGNYAMSTVFCLTLIVLGITQRCNAALYAGIAILAFTIVLFLLTGFANAIPRTVGKCYGYLDCKSRRELEDAYHSRCQAPQSLLGQDSILFEELLRHWHRRCNCRTADKAWPTRLLFVADADPRRLRLVETTEIRSSSNIPDYVALSHCWGGPTEEERQQFCTTRENYQHRLTGFTLDELPETFKHAVYVTRVFKKRYLWIDALCIIQSQSINGADELDWKVEAGRMEQVFSSASLTIAASSAANWKEGFLTRKNITNGLSRIFPSPFASLKQHTISQFRNQYSRPVRDDCNDFKKAIDSSPLNQRAWVLQERILSPRTVYFTRSRVFWQCGAGVSCDDFTGLVWQGGPEYYLQDPRFPDLLKQADYHQAVFLFTGLFERYSRLSLTNLSDKYVAIYSLLGRIERVFRTQCRYGVFMKYLPRLLLWRRIEQDNASGDIVLAKNDMFPSWSWLTYSNIEFIHIDRMVKPGDSVLQFSTQHERGLNVQVRKFSGYFELIQGTHCYVLDNDSRQVGEVWLDSPAVSSSVFCVFLGREIQEKKISKKRFSTYLQLHILLLSQQDIDMHIYARVGVGKVAWSCVDLSECSEGFVC